MALAIGGRRAEAERAYEWLVDCQRARRRRGTSTTWPTASSRTSSTPTSSPTSPPACGTTGCCSTTAASSRRMWPMVERAIDFVLDLQTPRGEILWARHADGTPWSFALLTGSSSICHSLRCAIALAELLGHERPDWELSRPACAGHHAHVAGELPDAFAPKHRWAMDWYYPVLTGVLRRRGRPRAPRRRAATPSSMERQGRALRERPTVGHRGRDVRVPAGLPRRRRARAGPRRCSPGPSTCAPTTATTGPASSTPSWCTSPATSSRPTPRPRSCWPPTPSAGASPASQLFVDHDALPAPHRRRVGRGRRSGLRPRPRLTSS